MSTRYVSLKALQRSSRSQMPQSRGHVPLLDDCAELRSRPDGIRPNLERLAQVLGAITKTNEYGDYLSVRCWCAQPPRFSPDARALQLLLPETPEDITDPDQWLFLDTETTGLSGGSGTYAFLIGVAWWESGGLEIEQFFMREYSEERALLLALRERIAELLNGSGVPEARIAEEAALLADRSDIEEELTRLTVHTAELKRILDEGGEIGKRLDFLLQEMNREANTTLSKSSGAGEPALQITNLGLAIKANIEKIREQSLNLE